MINSICLKCVAAVVRKTEHKWKQ